MMGSKLENVGLQASVAMIWEFANRGCKPGSDLRTDVERGKSLVLAAPDLLEALQQVAARWDAEDDRDAPELGSLIRATIAKATGKETV